MTPKRLALVLLAAISFLGPLAERLATGRVEAFSDFGLGETLVSLVVLFWWYHLDKQERNYQAGKLMNAGVLIAAVIALPIYFVRTRGWRGGAIAGVVGALFIGATFLLGELGEWLGAGLAP
ncbi:MAG TPA: hypothetical protein VM183_10150 [Burkholderiales bacterium]|nr:hypothetical protein [Burkholderiales bacterium]